MILADVLGGNMQEQEQCEGVSSSVPLRNSDHDDSFDTFSSLPLSSGFLPTPALSPTEVQAPEFPIVNGRRTPGNTFRTSVTEDTVCGSKAAVSFTSKTPFEDWPVASCTTRCTTQSGKQGFSGRVDATNWLFHRLCQPSPWENLDLHIAKMTGREVYSPETVSDHLMEHLAKAFIRRLRDFLGERYSQSQATEWAASAGAFPQMLPSRHSLRHIIASGLTALGHQPLLAEDAVSCQGGQCEKSSQATLPLIFAQGLLLINHRDAQRLALGILGCEKERTLGQVGLELGSSTYQTDLFQIVAAWSGCGWLMGAALFHHRITSAVCTQISSFSSKLY
jgi:hypothetical protein